MNNLEVFHRKKFPLELKDVVHAIYEENSYVYIDGSSLYLVEAPHAAKKYSLEKFDPHILKLFYNFGTICVITSKEVIIVQNQTDIDFFAPRHKIIAADLNPQRTTVLLVYENLDIAQFYYKTDNMNWTPFATSTLNEEVPPSVYVGWGHKETQFKGDLADQLYGLSFPMENQPYAPPTISYRGNAEMFVVNYWRDGNRYLKVVNDACEPLWSSKTTNGLLRPVDFKNEGNLMAAATKRDGKNAIIIFEKNCLPRTGFANCSVEDGDVIHDLKFHPYLKIIAVHVKLDADDYLNIYLETNGQWVLKQQLYYPAKDGIISFQWGREHYQNLVELNILTKEGHDYVALKIAVNCHTCFSVCATIFGREVGFSDYSEVVIPPPLFKFSWTMDNPINFVRFHPKKRHCVIIDSKMNGAIIDCDDPSVKIAMFRVATDEYFGYKADFIKDEAQLTMYCKNTTHAYLIDGYYNIQTIKSSTPEKAELNKLFRREVTVDDILFTIEMGALNQFYVNDQLVSNNVTSFDIFSQYLVFTTTENIIYTVKLSNELISKLSNFITASIFSRTIENGATLICITHRTAQTLLQMPRGNLELISCQLMSMRKIDEFLSNNNWKEAAEYIHMEKLSWDLLVDLNIDRFEQHLLDFINACNNPQTLANAVCDMHCKNSMVVQEDVEYAQRKRDDFKKIVDIIEKNCGMDYLNTMIQILIKHSTIRDALLHLVSLSKTNVPQVHVHVEKAIQLIKVHYKPDEIFKSAALVYDLDFLKYIMRLCNFDPMEYESKIAFISEQSDIRQRYELAAWADQKPVAAAYMVRMEEFDLDFVIKYIDKHRLYYEAYKACPKASSYRLKVVEMYARNLAQNGKHEEAGLALKRVGQYAKALEEFKLARNWTQVMIMAELMTYPPEEKKRLITDLANRLIAEGQVIEGCLLYQNFLSDKDKVIDIYLENNRFREAVNTALTTKHFHKYMGKKIVPALEKHCDQLRLKLMQDLYPLFEKYFERLRIVRQNMKKKAEAALMGEDLDDDLFSETMTTRSTTLSKRSKSSTASSRVRRKEERKMTNLREGGKYEDIALIRALYLNIEETLNLMVELHDIFALVNYDESNKNDSIIECLINIQNHIVSKFDIIWCNLPTSKVAEQDGDLQIFTQNFEHLAVEFRKPPAIKLKLIPLRNTK